MPRQARIVFPGIAHHVTQRGNNQQDVFFTDADRAEYLLLLREQSEKFGLSVIAYCLMSNHVHLVATPAGEDSLAKAVGRTNLRYAHYINRMHGHSGHLWQNRFFSSALDDEYYWNALIYVERNPVRAGLLARAGDYPWSSAAAHCDGRDNCGLLDLKAWQKGLVPGVDWRQAIELPQDAAIEKKMRTWSNRGCPLGSDSFVSKIEVRLNMRLRPAPRGRPPKKKQP